MNFKPIETDENVLVMPGAVVCGDVTVGEGTAFWFNSVCRAELQPIKIGKRCNIQDCAVIHNLCTLGDDVSVGHGAIVHGATVGDRVIVGMGYRKRFFTRENEGVPNVTNAIAHATVTTSIDLGATAILTVTKGGRTARTLSKFRPTCPIIAATTSERAQRQLNLSWGVIPIKSEEMSDSDSLFDHAVTRAMEEGLLKDGDLIVITAGLPLGVSGTTNMMKVHIVGDVLLKGKGATAKAVTAPVCVCKNEEDAIKLCHSGDILVIPKTSNNIMSVLKSAAGIVVEDTNPDCHAAVVGQALDIPVIYGAENASNVLKSGVTVTIDAEKGLICSSNN